MAGYGASLDETPEWRLSILFLVIVVLSLVGHVGLHMLEDFFRKYNRRGLKHTLHSLKDEIFALGLITLFLLAFQDYIIEICIDGDSDNKDSDYNSSYDVPKGNRKLLAAKDDSVCPEGKESFWSKTALHEIHILIFLIAVVHLLQASLSMLLASVRVKRWKRYENAPSHDLLPLKRKSAVKTKGSWVGLWAYSFFGQFKNIDGPMYLAIRRLFLERLELDDDFNFYTFVVDCMEEDFAKLVEFQWVMWLIATVWILLPKEAYAIIWLPCTFVLLMIVVGAKLESVAIQLATIAYQNFSPKFIPHKKRNILARASGKIAKKITGNSQKKNQEGNPDLDSVNGRTEPQSIATMVQGSQTQDIERRREDLESVQDSKHKAPSKLKDFIAQEELLRDTSSLFWFSKPKLVLFVFQYVYFQSGLLIALLVLDEWRDERINNLHNDAVYFVMIAVNIIVMIHCAFYVLPIYAVTVAGGAYGPEIVLRKAIAKNVNPQLAIKLRRLSASTDQNSKSTQSIIVDVQDHINDEDDHHHHTAHDNHGHGHGHDDLVSPISQILDAMDKSFTRKKKMEEQQIVLGMDTLKPNSRLATILSQDEVLQADSEQTSSNL